MKKKRLWGDNYVNIQCMSMVRVHCPSHDCYISISIPFVLSTIWSVHASIMNKLNGYGEITL